MNAEALSGKVLGTCTLQELIGRGGMGAVFLAQQSRPKRQVAVKVLLPMNRLQPGQQKAFLARFRRETDAAASLEHQNIMPVHEYGESEGFAYLVMPYVSGGTLRDELDREGKLPFTKTVSYLEQMAEALTFAHERGIVHRDIKPANIMLTPDKRVLLTDFGLVKIIAEGHISQNPLSDVGMPMGTPDYMSPEQVVGSEIDARADIYALAVLTYHMVAGDVPFVGEMPMKVALQHLHNVPPSPQEQRPDLPAEAAQVILRAMAKQPADRYESARAFALAFRLALEDAGVVLDPQPTVALAVQGERPATNRPRGLFDPLWRKVMRTPALPEAAEPEVQPVPASPQDEQLDFPGTMPTVPAPLTEEIVLLPEEPFKDQPVPASTKSKNDIVAKTSMTLPSFSGLLVPEPAPGPLQEAPTGTSPMAAKITPLPATETMENQSFYQRPAPQDPYGQAPVPPEGEAPAANNQFSRMRLGKPPGPQGQGQNRFPPQPAQQPGQTGIFQPQAPTAGSMQPPAGPAPFQQQTGNWQGGGNFPNGHGQQPGANGTFPNNPFAGPPAQPGTPMRRQTGALNAPAPQPGATGTFPNPYGGPQPGATGTFNTRYPTGSLQAPQPGQTGALMIPASNEATGQTGMLKLTQSVKVVKVPVAGQPGQYVTGLLPVLPSHIEEEMESPQQRRNKRIQTIGMIIALVIILGGSLGYLLTRPAGGPSTTGNDPGQANPTATLIAGQTATAFANDEANLIMHDSLTTNTRNWFVGNQGNASFSFKDNAYHVQTKSDEGRAALTTLSEQTPPETFAYTLSMSQVGGVDDSDFNFFGLVLRHQQQGDRIFFYTLALINNKENGKYVFQKFDSQAAEEERWTTVWEREAGDEANLGIGEENTLKVFADKTKFTFFVNGKEVGKAQDGSWPSGQIGVFVNYKDTEVAFRDLYLTYK